MAQGLLGYTDMQGSRTGRGTALAALLIILATSTPAHASEPTITVVAATADGVSASTLEILDSTILEKVPALGYKPAGASADKILSTHLVRSGDEVIIHMFVHDTSTGKKLKNTAKTTSSGVLAQVVKLLKKSLPKPSPEPAPIAKPAPKPTPVAKKPAPGPASKAPEPSEIEKITDPQVGLVYGVYEDLHRNSTALIASGTVTTIAGLAFTITAGVLWKRFEDWQDWAEENACLECVSKGKKKMKVNLAITGVGIGLLLPGVMVLVAGIGKRQKALRLRAEMARVIPDMNLALSRDSGELTLTWRFS